MSEPVRFGEKLKTLLLFSLLAAVIAAAVHEMGHGLVVLALGGRIEHLQPFLLLGAPHILYSGVTTDSGRALVALGGVALAVGLGVLGLFMVPFQRFRPIIAVSLSLIILGLIGQSLAGVVVPVLHMLGVALRDDMTTFMEFSGWHPALVSALFLIVFAASHWLLFRKARLVWQIRNIDSPAPLTPCSRSAQARLPGRHLFTAWCALVIGLTGLAGGYHIATVSGQHSVSIAVETLDRLTLTTIDIHESHLPQQLRSGYSLRARQGRFSISVIAPDGTVQRPETMEGQDMTVSTPRSAITVPVHEAGTWEVLVGGEAEELQIQLFWSTGALPGN